MKYRFILLLLTLLILPTVFSWYYPTYNYRKPIYISSQEELYNYSMQISVNLLDLIASGKVNENATNVRFTYVYPNGTEVPIPFVIDYIGWNISVHAYYSLGSICVSDMNNFPNTPVDYGGYDFYSQNLWNNCDNCDYYARVYLNITGKPKSVIIHVVSDDGQTVWVNGHTVGHAGGGCHQGGTANRYWDITSYLHQGLNEIRLWCSEATGGQRCNFELIIDGIHITKNGNYSKPDLIWIRVPYLPANQQTTVFMYYGAKDAQPTNYTLKDIFLKYYPFNTQSDLEDWTFSGTRGWTICTSTPYGIVEGNGTACNQDIGNSQSACMELLINCNTKCQILFNWSVSSEANYDYLRFYIDGSQVSAISGYRSWTAVSRILNPGSHRIKFCYTKDGSVSRGTDTGYVDNLKIITYSDNPPSYTVGQEEVGLQVNITIHSPKNNTIYPKDIVTVNATITYTQNTSVNVTILLDDTPIKTFVDVANNSEIVYIIPNIQDGNHSISLNVSAVVGGSLLYKLSDPVYFAVDTTPPNITIIYPEPKTYRISYTDTTIPIHVVVSDNFGVKNCTIILWNGTKLLNSCNKRFDLDVGILRDGQYNISVIAYDLVNNSATAVRYFSLDYPQGRPVFSSVDYPHVIPAKTFNISANITCVDDWCDSVTATLVVPNSCHLLSNAKQDLGTMDEFETKSVVWSLYCDKDRNYTFTINLTSSNNVSSSYQFVAYPPELFIYIVPKNPTENDDVSFLIYPYGYGRSVNVSYKVILYRAGEGSIILDDTTIVLPSDVNSTVYTVSSNQIRAGDKLIFFVRLIEPVNFYEEKNLSTIVYDDVPPSILAVSLKYSNTAPHDALQNISFMVTDNNVVSKVDLFVDYGNGTYILAKTKNYSSYLVRDYFLLNHSAYIGNTIKLFLVAYDAFNNTAISDVYEYYVAKDNPPSIYIRQPTNGSVYNYTDIVVVFKASDDFSNTLFCKINNKQRNVSSGSLSSVIIEVSNLTSTINVTCSDEFNNTASKAITIFVDTVPPELTDISYYAEGTNVNFNITVADNFRLDKLVVKTIVNGTVDSIDQFNLNGTVSTVSFTKSMYAYAGKIVGINITVCDAAGNCYTPPTLYFAVSKPVTPEKPASITINTPPKVKIVNYTIYPKYIVGISFIVEDDSQLVFCELHYDSGTIPLGYIPTNKLSLYNWTVGKSGTYSIYITCVDPEGLRGISNLIKINVTYIPPKPTNYLNTYTAALLLKDRTVSAPLGVGLVLTAIGIIAKLPLLLTSGISLVVSGPLVAYGITHGDPVASTAGTVLGFIVWIILDLLVKRGVLTIP